MLRERILDLMTKNIINIIIIMKGADSQGEFLFHGCIIKDMYRGISITRAISITSYVHVQLSWLRLRNLISPGVAFSQEATMLGTQSKFVQVKIEKGTNFCILTACIIFKLFIYGIFHMLPLGALVLAPRVSGLTRLN